MIGSRIAVPHICQGRLVIGEDRQVDIGTTSLLMPALDLDALVLPRSEAGPAFDLPMTEIISFLEQVGKELQADSHGYLDQARRVLEEFSPLSNRVLENCYRRLPDAFSRESLEFQVDQQLPVDALDGWIRVTPPGTAAYTRAFPPRTVQVLAGNSPNVAATSITRSALTKGVHLLKLAVNDPVTAPAIARIMAEIDPEHPVVRSFSIVYWPGGDRSIEDALFRAQYFDKIIAWGGEAAIRSALGYAAPGLEVLTYDPKVSISMIGRETFASDSTLHEATSRAATDAMVLNQNACSASVYQFVEGSIEEVDKYCELLVDELAQDRPTGDGCADPTPSALREEILGLRTLEPIYRVWGDFEGRGVVVRSDEPVEFHPSGKVVNVVAVEDLEDALRWVTVATQTVGIYPSGRKRGLRDQLACRGAQRLVSLGNAAVLPPGLAHDGSLPLQRLVRWITVESDADDVVSAPTEMEAAPSTGLLGDGVRKQQEGNQ